MVAPRPPGDRRISPSGAQPPPTGTGYKAGGIKKQKQGHPTGCPLKLWSGRRGSNPLPGIPRTAFRHSQEPSRTSHSTGLRPWVEAAGPRLPVAASLRWIFAPIKNGAGDGARTRYLHLGKVALYQMSYARRTLWIIAKSRRFVNGKSKIFRAFSPAGGPRGDTRGPTRAQGSNSTSTSSAASWSG